ncbi:MAG: hypothetical protein H0T73_16865, partial [Ardenticatenales bacterium]|nr:hypothetical protein [Ardenticatenales bacterium]
RLFQTLHTYYQAPYAVLLNACHSLVAAQAIAPHVPLVIGMAEALGDDEALEFADAFYYALPSGSWTGAFEVGSLALPRSEQTLAQLLAWETLPPTPWVEQSPIEKEQATTVAPAWLEEQAQRRARHRLLFYLPIPLTILVVVVLGIMIWTWEVMEPITFVAGALLVVWGYVYFALTLREFSPHAFYDHLLARLYPL